MRHSHTRSQIEVQENVPLAPLTTIGVGGPARFFTRVTIESELVEALDFARVNRLPVLALGGGSNLLIRDSGFAGLAVQLALDGEVQTTEAGSHVGLRVPAGVEWDSLVLQVAAAGLSGMECLAGIPGLTGGTPIQNVGAYGQEVSQTLASVRALDRRSQAFVELSAEECGLAYRSSRFNGSDRDRYVLTAVTFRLDRNARPCIRYADLERRFGDRRPSALDVYHAVREIRQAKGMLLVPNDPDCRSAGSFFKNPVVSSEVLHRIATTAGIPAEDVPHWPARQGHVKLAAAWLMEQAGYHRGVALGAAGISSRHTLALINRGGATFADVAALRDQIRQAVRERFAIELEQEPVEVGD